MPFNIVLPTSTAASRWTSPRCGLCRLDTKCNSPKMPLDGRGKKKILILGEAPGETEDQKNKPFVGKAGNFLEEKLGEDGIDMRNDCWMYNALICHPAENRTPTSEEISYCRPNLTNILKDIKPNVIVPVGRVALESVLSGIWKEDIGPIGRWVGWKIPSVELNAWILPTWHPSYILRELSEAKKFNKKTPIEIIFKRHLKQIGKITKKPYETVPDYPSQIEIVLDPKEAAKRIRQFARMGGPIAFDYETDCLKPDEGGKIYTASVCWRGHTTIAFPFYGSELIQAWADLMASDCPKIGHNMKFEARWTRRQKVPNISGTKTRFGRMKVNNLVFDTMIGAHIVDNRRAICSLSFQTFINLGVGDYSTHISKFLEQAHSYHSNNIKQINLEKLLLYNGLDSLFTYLIAMKQLKFFGIKI